MALLFVRQRGVLCVYERMLFRFNGYAYVLISRVEADLYRLRIKIFCVQQLYRKRMMTDDLHLHRL